MNYVISEDQIKKLLEQSEKALEPLVSRFFKFLNTEKKKYKKRQELLNRIKELSRFFNLPKGSELYLLELYLHNYREDGDYSNLTKDNFVDPRKTKGKRTRNTDSNLYTVAQLPFRGSNLEGYWDEDSKGIPYYVVKSYNWYPVYIFKQGRWYENIQRWSSSTGKQMYNANPVEYNDELSKTVILATKEEMEKLENDWEYEDVIKNKKKSLKKLEPELQKTRMSRGFEYGGWDDEVEARLPGYLVKFKVNSIESDGDKPVVVVDIFDVLKTEGSRGLPTPQNYLKGELPNVTKERVEKTVERKLLKKLKPFVGTRHGYWDLPENAEFKLKFNHLKK